MYCVRSLIFVKVSHIHILLSYSVIGNNSVAITFNLSLLFSSNRLLNNYNQCGWEPVPVIEGIVRAALTPSYEEVKEVDLGDVDERQYLT